MKKSLVALAIFGAYAGVAQAQSAVTMYGSFDGGVRQVDNVDALGNNKTSVGSNGTYNSNRLGFKGVEDLGNGMNAHFNLEAGFNTGTGSSSSVASTSNTARLFDRTASVGLGGGWGSLDFGRQYSISFRTIGAYDPFNYKYTGIIPLAVQAASGGTGIIGAATTASNFGGYRFDNDIQYAGTFGAITARAEYAPGEVAGSTKARASSAVGLSYAQGPFSAGAAYTQKQVSPAFSIAGPNFDDKAWTVGGAFRMDAFRVAVGYNNEKISGANAAGTAAIGDAKQRLGWVGGSYLITPAFELTAAWYQTRIDSPAATAAAFTTGKRDMAIVGATYALSKRTSLYGDVDTTKLNGNQVLGFGTSTTRDRTTGLSLGVNHFF